MHLDFKMGLTGYMLIGMAFMAILMLRFDVLIRQVVGEQVPPRLQDMFLNKVLLLVIGALVGCSTFVIYLASNMPRLFGVKVKKQEKP